MPSPRFPLYIPSKSRAAIATTPRILERMGLPYLMVVEEQQHAEYARYFNPKHLLILDSEYQRNYDTFDDLGDTKSKGSGPARNFIWDHSAAAGAEWHWIMDDNITYFQRLHRNQRIALADGTGFAAMEDFCLRYTNIAMAGPHYQMFAPSRSKLPPFEVGTRVYSCNLIRNDVPFRWRGRYNEDTDLSLRMLKAGWATVQFFAFLQNKLTTQYMTGGNTEAWYAKDGTRAKSEMLVREHPDVARLAVRYGRVHHVVDYSQFRTMRLIRRPDYVQPEPYRMALVDADRPWREVPDKPHA